MTVHRTDIKPLSPTNDPLFTPIFNLFIAQLDESHFDSWLLSYAAPHTQGNFVFVGFQIPNYNKYIHMETLNGTKKLKVIIVGGVAGGEGKIKCKNVEM